MNETFQHGDLKLEARDGSTGPVLTWLGRSTARDPGNFIGPILANLYKQASSAGKGLVLDFRKLEYMNSSTITPVIRLLHEAKKGGGKVSIVYTARVALAGPQLLRAHHLRDRGQADRDPRGVT
jgi:hypothetical protein